jgi:hypothetical protein
MTYDSCQASIPKSMTTRFVSGVGANQKEGSSTDIGKSSHTNDIEYNKSKNIDAVRAGRIELPTFCASQLVYCKADIITTVDLLVYASVL